MERNFFNNFIRGLFSTIDYHIYNSIEWVTQGIFDLVQLRTNVSIVEDVKDKIYVFLGIFMLFKISASLISYLINPDQMTDKEKGASKLIGRTIAMLAILMFSSLGFDLIYRSQSAFLPMLPKILLGKEETTVTGDVADKSNAMAVTLLQAFFHPYYTKESNGDYVSSDGAKEIETLEDIIQYYDAGYGNDSNPLLGTKASYSYEYIFLLSTVVGIVVLIILIGITIDVAVRLFKMLVLEMLAPIPIMSFVDPKSQKDGPFQNWLRELGRTYIDIFVKLGLIYLFLFFIEELQNNTLFVNYGNAYGSGISPVRLLYLKIFIIIGLLMFLKQAPKFIKGIFGIKDNKDGGSFLGNVAGGLAGFGAGAVSGAISGRGLRGAITGGISGMAAGYQGAATGKPANAWQVGGDAAIQARLGDKNAKSGIAAAVQRKATASQMRAQAAKLNLTKDTVDLAKNNWIAAQTEATNAEWKYRDLLSQATHRGTDPTYESEKAAAYADWQDKVTISGDRERNYNKAKEAYEKVYGQEEKAYERYANGPVHRATKRATAAARSAIDSAPAGGGRTIAQRRQERTDRTARNGGFNPNK